LTGGFAGGIVATVAIFLPSFIFIALLGPLLPRIRKHPIARGALDGMNAGVVALIAVTAIFLTHDAITSIPAAAIAVGTLIAILVFNVNATLPLLAAAGIGWICHRAGL
jgi:chromate transporter